MAAARNKTRAHAQKESEKRFDEKRERNEDEEEEEAENGIHASIKHHKHTSWAESAVPALT